MILKLALLHAELTNAFYSEPALAFEYHHEAQRGRIAIELQYALFPDVEEGIENTERPAVICCKMTLPNMPSARLTSVPDCISV